MTKNAQRIISVRLPWATYRALEDRSIREQISVSSLVRNVLIGFLRCDDEELTKIRCYGISKSRMIQAAIEKEAMESDNI